ncbi:hypothetical protein [uncultured Microscilla sp.]|uniref:hypothetical protein n=1 Tax=uncultured Microscilla sp. TaxID=432653 RepID=UPI002624F771|nr:hypothetical protein [uncultured Microscilla sp.]
MKKILINCMFLLGGLFMAYPTLGQATENYQDNGSSNVKSKGLFLHYDYSLYCTDGSLNFSADNDATGDSHYYFYGSGTNNEHIAMAVQNHYNKDKPDASNAVRVGINTSNPGNYALYVNGDASITEGITVEVSSFPDYVFANDYSLMPLNELGAYIGAHHHLPKMPKAEQVIREGLNIKQVGLLLVEKVEELTLYTLSRHQQLKDLNQRLQKLEKAVKK